MSNSNHSQKPLVLLDVDGVINDLGSFFGHSTAYGIDVVRSHGYEVHIPDYMPRLIQWVATVAEIHWCTTWRHRANDEIAAHLGVGPFPVVDDGTNARVVDWKPAAAYEVAQQALAAGRRVIWFEDFFGDVPFDEMPEGTEFIDTVVWGHAVLTTAMVDRVLPLSASESVRAGF